jgi:hypothetical protein
MKSGLGPYGWLPVLPPEWPQQSWEIFRHYVNEYLPQLFRISADHIHSKAVEEQLVQRAFRNQYMMSTLLAQAALHLSVRNESYRVFALEYYAQAILGLRGYLGTNSVEFDAINVSLAALGLCIFEVGGIQLYCQASGVWSQNTQYPRLTLVKTVTYGAISYLRERNSPSKLGCYSNSAAYIGRLRILRSVEVRR